MKKHILGIFLLSSMLFFGLNIAKAAQYTIAATPVTGGLSTNPVPYGSVNYAVYGFNLVGNNGTNGANATVTYLTFSNIGNSYSANGYGNDSFFGTAYLYKSPAGASYTPGTTNVAANLIGTAVADGSADITFNGINVPIASNTTASNATYYIVFANDLVGTSGYGNYQLQLTDASSTRLTNIGTNAVKGNVFTFTGPPVSLGTATTTGLAAAGSLNSATQTQQGIFGFSISTTANTTISGITFTPTVSTGNMGNYFTNVTLFVNTTNSFAGATAVPAGYAVSSLAGSTVTITGLTQAINNTTKYYFIKADYIPPTSGNPTFQLNATSATTSVPSTATFTTGGPINGTVYTLYNGVTTATAIDITPSPNSGLLTSPLINPQVGAIYGMSLNNSGTAASPSISSLTFNSVAPRVNSYYMADFTLFSSPTNSFSAGTATQVGTTQTAGANNTVTFSGLNIIVPASGSVYYFVSVTYNGVAANSTFQLNFGSATTALSTTSVTANATNTGFNYTCTAPTYTLVTNTTGIQTAATPYYYGSTGDVLESFGVSATSNSAVFNSVTLKPYINGANGNGTPYTTYFSNLTIYSSSNPNYAADLAGTGSPLTSVPFTTTGTGTLVVTLSTPQALAATPIYYFVVGDFTNGDNLFTNTTTAATFQFRISAAGVTSGANNVTPTNTYAINYTTYNLLSPVALNNATTTGLATANQLNYDQNQVGILGFAVTSVKNETITTMNFSAAISSFNSTIGTFFSNITLYVNTSNNFNTATAVPAGYTVSNLNSTTMTISGLSQAINSTTLYYFIKANYTAPSTYSSTFQLSATSVTNTDPTTFTANATIDGIIYNCSPNVLLGTATTTGLATNPITTSATSVGLFGFSLFSGPGYTFTQFNLSSVQPAGEYLNTNFANYKLYVNTTNNFNSATLVTVATFSNPANSNTLTISGLNQAIPAGTTYYYFIKADYTSPAVATTYELNLNSVATSSTTYTTGGPIYGTDYTLTGPKGVYYYTGDALGITWETAGNWLNAYTGNSSGYPGQTLNNDIAVFSPTYADGNFLYGDFLNITTTKTLQQIIVQSKNLSPFTVEIKNGLTCTVTNGITLGDAGQLNANGRYSSQLQLAETSNNGTGIFYISGSSNLYNDGSLAIAANVVFSAASTVNMFGTTADPAFIGTFTGGFPTGTAAANATGTNVTFNCTGPSSEIYGQSGIFSVTSSTLNFSGLNSQIFADGAAMTLTGSTVNATGTSSTNAITGIGLDAGSMTVTGSSVVNLGTSSSNGSFTTVNSSGGTFTLSGSSTINLLGNSANIANDYYIPGALGIMNINASTINMGSSLIAGNGASSEILNSSNFNLNASSVINMNGANTEILNTSTTYGGSTYPGIFVNASTSVINPSSTTATVYNTLASNYFTLLSDANATATIGQLGSGAKLAGKYNVQRYLRGGAGYLRNYTLLSSPVNTNAYASSQYNTIDMTYLGAQATIPYTTPVTYYGAFIAGPGAGFGGGIHTIPNALMYLYQENIVPGTGYNSAFTSGKNVGVISLNTSNSTVGTINTAPGIGVGSPSSAAGLPGYDNSTGVNVPPGNGYILYYIDNDARTTAASVASIPNASNVTASGYINQGQVQLYMWGSRSSNLTDTYGLPGVRLPGITVVGNPYPSTIDLQKVYADNAGAITPTLYQLDKTTEQFDAYNASTHISSTAQSSEYVGSGLGFYVHVDSLGSTKAFYFQEDQKTPSATAGFYPPLSNFAVIENPAQPVADNVAGATNKGAITDAIASQGSGAAANGAQPGSGSAAAVSTHAATAGRGTSTLASANPPADTTKQTIPELTKRSGVRTERKNPWVPLPDFKPETPQPVQKPLPPSIANPAGLHLKFVVDSVTDDEIGVYFNKAWSDKFDTNDSFDMDGNSGKVYLSSFTSDNIRTSVNTMGDYTGGKRVKLYVKAAADGIYQLEMTNIASSFNKSQYSVFLIDNLKKDSLDLTLYKSYNFNFAASDTAQFKNRFVLAIEHKPVPHYELLTFAGQKVTQGVQLNWKTLNEANSTNFVLQKLHGNNTYAFLDSLQSDSAGAYAYVDQHPVLGNNTYRLQQTDALGNITYSAPVTIGYNSTSPNGDLTIFPNPAKTTITVTLNTSSIASQVATADIYSTSGTLIAHRVVTSNSFNHDISNYQLGVYIIELKNSNGLIVGKAKFVKVQ